MEAARAAGPGSDCRAAGRLRGTAVAGGAQHRPHRRRTVRNRGARRALTTMSAPQLPGVFLTGERFAKAEAFFTRRGAFLIIIARFFGVAKQTFGLIAGITKMPFLRFLLCNTLGALLWIGLWASVGYVAGDHITPIYAGA